MLDNIEFKKLSAMLLKHQATSGKRTSETFSKLMRFVVFGFCTNAESSSALNPLVATPEEGMLLRDMFGQWVRAVEVELDKGKGYADIPGNLHQSVVYRKGGKGFLGQYFTPENVADCMAAISMSDSLTEEECPSLCDPACGSGRLLMAANDILLRKGKSGTFHAKDIDLECVMMTAANFLIHGMRGTVVWGNSLAPDDNRLVIATNPDIDNPLSELYHIPHCKIIK